MAVRDRGHRQPLAVYPALTMASDLDLILRYTDSVVPEDDLRAKLELGRPLRVKLGVDPTAPAVTLGWAVVLRKLRQFQDLGHTAVLIVGDFTAQVGDPSLKEATRRRLSSEEVNRFAESVLGQFRKVLSSENLEIRRNSEWLGKLDMTQLLELTSSVTVAQMLERSDFGKRFAGGVPISVMEFLYPLLQGYDSVAVEADIELGGSDQLWNLMMGRTVQERYGMATQVAMTVPLLIGTDGSQKMSQSLGNYVGVEDPPGEMFGKTMSIPDELMGQWFRLAADLDPEEVGRIEADLVSGALHPAEAKRRLAREVVALYHGEQAAHDAEKEFDEVFRHGGEPEEMPVSHLPAGDTVSVPALLRDVFGISGAEARRLIDQGAVTVENVAIREYEVPRDALTGMTLRAGKRRFARLVE